jgi:hypothetical protein
MARGPLTSKIDVDKIGQDTPLRLSVAAAVAYPDGSMTASGLRREARRGRLVPRFDPFEGTARPVRLGRRKSERQHKEWLIAPEVWKDTFRGGLQPDACCARVSRAGNACPWRDKEFGQERVGRGPFPFPLGLCVDDAGEAM